MVSKIDRAWNLFLEGKISEAKKLVEQDFFIDTCTDFSLLNLMGYVLLAEKDYDSCTHIFEKYVLLAQQNENKENEHIGLHQLAMIYREQGNFHKALKLIENEEEIIKEHFPNDNLKKAVNNYEQGYLRLKLNNLDEALTFMNLSLEQSLETYDVISLACSYRGIGEIYLALEDKGLANTHFKRAIELFESVGEFEGIKEIEELINR
ncbi:tetratricopeptide repeat protein [Streptococcus cristatus]|jgi:tetratricopeptide repeat protein|uniref:tetratricopeptide repeat protein n=1 Tax=Streptococcus cristatus TaxID=45634 RepID=UPI0039C245C9